MHPCPSGAWLLGNAAVHHSGRCFGSVRTGFGEDIPDTIIPYGNLMAPEAHLYRPVTGIVLVEHLKTVRIPE